MKRNQVSAVRFSAYAKIVITGFNCYVPQKTPNVQQQVKLSVHNLSKAPSEFYYIQMASFKNEVITQNRRTSELGTAESINKLINLLFSS